MEQRSEEWFAARAGKFTGSRFSDVMARTKTGKAAAYKNLIAALAVERMIGTCMDTYQNAAMMRGIELEPEARAEYERETFRVVDEIAFVQHPDYDFIGCSPDGLVGKDGMVEIKCPSAQGKHYDAIIADGHTKEYRWQLQGQLWICNRQWVDAVSYDPRFPEGLRLAIARVERDEEAIKELESACLEAEQEVRAAVAALESRRAA